MPFPDIIYEDNHILAINKPAGMLSQGDGSDAADVLTEIRAFIKKRDNKPGNVFIGLVHRLDRPVSGALVLAKTSKAASRLSAAIRQRAVSKVYWATLEGDVTARFNDIGGRLVHFLVRDDKTRVSHITREGGKEARLTWQILNTAPHRSLVAVHLETGLPHQIRAQFAAIGHPIVGDRKYGAKQKILNTRGVIALFCQEMQVPHPTQNKLLSIVAPPPYFWETL